MTHWSLWFVRAFFAGSYLALQTSLAQSFYPETAWKIKEYAVAFGTTAIWMVAYNTVRIFYEDAYLPNGRNGGA